MKRPLFDIITTAHTGRDGMGAFDVRIIGKYGAIDGQVIGHTEDVTFNEAMQYATDSVEAFMAEAMGDRSN